MSVPRGMQARSAWLPCLVVILGALLCAATAAAAPASFTVDSAEPALVKRDDGSATVGLTLNNQTDGELTLDVTAAGATGCRLGVDKTKLPAHVGTPVTVLVPAGCKSSSPLKLALSVVAGKGAAQKMEVTPKEETEEKPDWDQLIWGFGGALLVAAILLSILFWLESKQGRRPGQRLDALDATWEFNDNWGTNVTAVGALLTGLFGASTAKVFLGEDAESLVALATVGAAISLVFVAAATIVLLATKSYRVKESTGAKVLGKEAFTVGGVVLSAALVLTAAGGQLWVTTYTARELGLGDAEFFAWGAAVVGALLLGVYSWRALRNILESGTADSEAPPEPVVEIEAAEIIAKAIKAAAKGEPEKASAMEALDTQIEKARGVPRRSRSALI